MFEMGDWVRVVSNGETRKVVGIGPGEFFSTQIGNDGSTVKPFKGADLEMVARAERRAVEPGFVPFTLTHEIGNSAFGWSLHMNPSSIDANKVVAAILAAALASSKIRLRTRGHTCKL